MSHLGISCKIGKHKLNYQGEFCNGASYYLGYGDTNPEAILIKWHALESS